MNRKHPRVFGSRFLPIFSLLWHSAELRRLYSSPSIAVQVEFCEHAWNPWSFRQTPRKWWIQVANGLRCADPVARCAAYQYANEKLLANFGPNWADIEPSQLPSAERQRLDVFGGIKQFAALLNSSFPAVTVKDISTYPQGHWKQARNRYDLLQSNFTTQDLLSVTAHDIARIGGSSALSLYNYSPFLLIVSTFPLHWWRLWDFHHAPRDVWRLIARNFQSGCPVAESLVRDYLHTLKCTPHTPRLLFGLAHLGGSISAVSSQLDASGHSMNKKATLLATDSITQWESPEQRYHLLEKIRNKYSNQSLDSMYTISTEILRAFGATSMLTYYRGSLFMLVMTEYPYHAWLPWRFERAPQGWWDDIAQGFAGDPVRAAAVRLYIEHLATTWGIHQLNDWYRVGLDMLRQTTRAVRLYDLGGLSRVLKTLYPDHPWKVSRFSSTPKNTQQRTIRKQLNAIMPL